MTDAASSPMFRGLTHEQAYDMADELRNKKIERRDAVEIISGEHPTEGRVYIVIPPWGESVILPVAEPVVLRELTL